MRTDDVNRTKSPLKNNLKTKFIRIAKKDICYFQFILEGYEGFVTATTIDKKRAIVKLFIVPEFQDSVEVILKELKKELNFEEIDFSEITGERHD